MPRRPRNATGGLAYPVLNRRVGRLPRLDVWIHRSLRALVWKQWKRARTRITELIARGIPKAFAVPVGASRKGP